MIQSHSNVVYTRPLTAARYEEAVMTGSSDSISVTMFELQHVVDVFVDRQPHCPELNIVSHRSITACVVVVLRSRCRS